MHTLLQSTIFPNKEFNSSVELYCRHKDCRLYSDHIVIPEHKKISFDTYYNAFSLNLWNKRCNLDRVQFSVVGTGHAKFKLFGLNSSFEKTKIVEISFVLQGQLTEIFDIDLSSLTDQTLLFVEVYSQQGDCIIRRADWTTETAPKRLVKLGIVITHFNRKEYVLPSIARIKSRLLDCEEYKGKIGFTVIDNSRNITPQEAAGVTVIPNDNSGGSGGFMRGLIHYQNEPGYTHILFMDDDGSFEIDAIKRTYSFLSYVVNANSALAGSLIFEDSADYLAEKAGKFDEYCKPICFGTDLRPIENLVHIENDLTEANYGGWWFFAFPINVKHFSFPFFVRGDDVFFGMMNKFEIVSTLGIACYGPNFEGKVSNLTKYLDQRYHILNNLLFSKTPLLSVLKIYGIFYLFSLLSHQYSGVEANRLALRHAFSDKDFWIKNFDLKSIRKNLSTLSTNDCFIDDINEITVPLDFNIDVRTESTIRRITRFLTMNGVLLPLIPRCSVQKRGLRASFRNIFRYKYVFYTTDCQSGTLCQVSRSKFLKYLALMILDIIKILIGYRSARNRALNYLPELTSKQIWLKLLGLKGN